MTSTLLRSLPLIRIVVVAAVLVAGFAFMVNLPAQAAGDCGIDNWSQDANPYADQLATTFPGDENYAGISGAYNAWNAANNYGWVYNEATIGECSPGGGSLPYATIMASPMTITEGQSSLLSWGSQNVGACTINQGIGSVTSNTTGSRTVTPTSNTTYTLTCAGADPASVTVIVEPIPAEAPTATLSANPSAITSGQSSTLTWGSENATSCVGTNFSTAGATSGTISVSPTALTYYSVTCSNGVGSQTAYASVNVTSSAGADLRPLSLVPTRVTVNVPSTFTATIENTGTAATPAFTSRVFVCGQNDTACMGGVSTETLWDKTVAFLAPIAHAASPVQIALSWTSIPASSTGTQTGSRTFTQEGNYMMRLCADNDGAWNGSVIETNENDNCGNWTLLVVGPAGEEEPVGGAGTVTCNVSDTSVAVGEQVTYTAVPSGGAGAPYVWTDTPDAGTNLGDGTTLNRTYTATGTYAMSLTANGASSAGFCANVSVGSTAPSCPGTPSATITASPDRVRSGSTSRITWSAQNVQGSCTITGPGINRTVTAASCAVPSDFVDVSITAQSVYRITCTGATDTAVVNLLPVIEEF